MVAILSNQIKTKNMKQELITRIRCILNFMEETGINHKNQVHTQLYGGV